jgi:hypothetical protein
MRSALSARQHTRTRGLTTDDKPRADRNKVDEILSEGWLELGWAFDGPPSREPVSVHASGGILRAREVGQEPVGRELLRALGSEQSSRMLVARRVQA